MSGFVAKNHELTPLSILSSPNGDVFRLLRNDDSVFRGFGEAYISTLNPRSIKAWKNHSSSYCNFTVTLGDALFVVKMDDYFFQYRLSPKSFYLLTINPGTWFGFKSMCSITSHIINISTQPHDPTEVKTLPLESFNFDWYS